MQLYRAKDRSAVIEEGGRYYAAEQPSWDTLVTRDDLHDVLEEILSRARAVEKLPDLLPPIGSQEVWAAGVTYFRSRTARMEESKAAGGGDFYDRVYAAERPELFFKAAPHRVVGSGGRVAIRKDSSWSVPEPELTLAVTPSGKILGYTIGNDMSSRDIEGENPLYLPQAKVYDGSCALGPGIWITNEPLPSSTEIRLEVWRDGSRPFSGSTTLAEMKRDPRSLVEYLFRQNSFPSGCFLMTGTGIVPPDSFSLQPKDEIRITIEPIGTLINTVG
ncbi:MAG: fumarylacetoacetate hydrolase family protein [Terriglobia bacterium]